MGDCCAGTVLALPGRWHREGGPACTFAGGSSDSRTATGGEHGADGALLRAVVSAAPIGVVIADRPGGEILYFNERFCEIWGLQPLAERLHRGELKYADIVAHCGVRAKDAAALVKAFQALHAPENEAAVDDEVELADGRTIRYVSRPAVGAAGQRPRFYLFEDVTEYREAERGFAESERRLRSFVEGVEDYALYLLDLDGRVTSWNAGAEKLKGYTAAEVVGESFLRFYTPEDVELGVPDRALRTARQQGRFAQEGWRLRKDGSRFWAETVISAVPDESGRVVGYAKITRDVTSRKLAEEALRLNEARIRAIMDSTVDGLITIDQDGIIRMFSSPAERIFGYAAAEIVGQKINMLMPEPYRTQHDDYIHNYLLTGTRKIIGIGREVEGLKKDGTVFPMDLAVGELPPSGAKREFVGTIRDISARKTLEHQLLQAQKMEAVGQPTGGVAHDFNNLLAVILGNLDMMRERVAEPALKDLVETALRASQRGAELTQRLLAFSRRQMLRPETVDINQMVAGMIDLLRRTLGEMVQIRTTLSEDVWPVQVDPGQLENALLNLTVNARDAMPEGGVLTIETGNVVLDGGYAARSPDVAPGQYMLLTVSDTGIGMPPEVVMRAFEPFFTTKETGKGSGLGLSMVYGFVKQSGGHITIYSEPRHGTTVKIYLPPARGTAESSGAIVADAGGEMPRGKAETVLVVEDDVDVRRLATLLLRDLGYTVIEASDGPMGLSVFADHPEVRLLLTDIVLPRGMNGAVLAERIRAQRPNLPVLFMSGYAENSIIKTGIVYPGVKLINKPFRKAELARKVRQALDSAGAG